MSRRNSTDRTGRSKKAARHVRLYHWMMDKPAWKSLKASQRAILVEMYARYDGSNNGRIPYSVRDAAVALRISKGTASRELIVLQDRGFIVPMMKGAFSLKRRHATEWRLTEFNCDVTGGLPTKEFADWQPKIQNTVSLGSTTGTVLKPIGTSGETVACKHSPDGTSRETAAPNFANSRFHQKYTNKLPGSAASVPSVSGQATPEPEISPDLEIPKFLQRGPFDLATD